MSLLFKSNESCASNGLGYSKSNLKYVYFTFLKEQNMNHIFLKNE